MEPLCRRLRTSSLFYSLVVGALIMASAAQLRAQGEKSESSPMGRQFAALAHNTIAHQFVLFGGTDGLGTFDNTWVWRGAKWEELTPAKHPGPRIESAAAYDSARQEVVLFGGEDQRTHQTVSTPWATVITHPVVSVQGYNVVSYRDTWIWNGEDWIQKNSAQAPPGRSGHAMAYDAARKQVVLFGGYDQKGDLNDTWVWDGSDWRMMHPTNIPPARHWQAMAYDPTRQQVVMFGGEGKAAHGHTLDDTWIWDGNNWTKAEPSGDSPEARSEAGMDYDLVQKRLLLISGTVWDSTGRGSTANDSWVWAEDHWRKLPTTEFELIYDPSTFDPKDTNRALVVNILTPYLWVPRQVKAGRPATENVDGNPAAKPGDDPR